MKIKTILNEQYRRLKTLNEAQDLSDIDPQNASVDQIANGIQNSMEKYGNAEISDAAATKTAQEVKQAAQEVNASQVAIDPSLIASSASKKQKLGCRNEITDLLDLALEDAYAKIEMGWVPDGNVLLIGLPGSGKTSTVKSWARENGLNLVYVNVKDTDLEAGLYGYTARDISTPNSNAVTKLRSNYLDELDKPNSVLFLDELNRGSRSNRSAILDLVSAHVIKGEDTPEVKASRAAKGLDPEPTYRHFENMLFTIAAMNPADDFTGMDPNADQLFGAEKNRFPYTLKNVDSKKDAALDFVKKFTKAAIQDLNEKNPNFWKHAIRTYRQGKLLEYILNSGDFRFDTESDNSAIVNAGAQQLTQRTLTSGMFGTATATPQLAKNWINKYSDFLETDKKMLIKIIDEYINYNKEPSEEACRQAILAIKNEAGKEVKPVEVEERPEEDVPDTEADEFGQENDATIGIDGARELNNLNSRQNASRNIEDELDSMMSDLANL